MVGYNNMCVEAYMILRFVMTVWIMIIKEVLRSCVRLTSDLSTQLSEVYIKESGLTYSSKMSVSHN